MTSKPQLTAQRLRELLDYNPDTGVFTWRERSRSNFPNARSYRAWNARYAGKNAGQVTHGYIRIAIDNRKFYAHRLAALHVTGKWPASGLVVDHIDGDGLNNRWKNLRVGSKRLNALNSDRQRNIRPSSGVVAHRNKFAARCRFNGKSLHLGLFDTREEAHAAYLRKQRELPDSVHIQKEGTDG